MKICEECYQEFDDVMYRQHVGENCELNRKRVVESLLNGGFRMMIGARRERAVWRLLLDHSWDMERWVGQCPLSEMERAEREETRRKLIKALEENADNITFRCTTRVTGNDLPIEYKPSCRNTRGDLDLRDIVNDPVTAGVCDSPSLAWELRNNIVRAVENIMSITL